MMLFDESVLFDSGHEHFTEFNLPGAELKLWEHFIPKEEADKYYHSLLKNTPWQQRIRKMYDKMVRDPRLTAYFGGENGFAWTPELLEIKGKVEAKCGISFDRVLLNYYRDGNDSVAWHSDTLPKDGKHHPIASVTFGETRSFKVRPKGHVDAGHLDIPLRHGSLLLMGETMQDLYEHHIAKTTRKIGARINLTFRISESMKQMIYEH